MAVGEVTIIDRLIGVGGTARFRWKVPARAEPSYLNSFPGVHPLVVQILRNRTITSASGIGDFLGGPAGDLGDPWELRGMESAIARLHQARESGEIVAIYGDYDVDGVTSTTLLTECLRDLGLSVLPFVPGRYTHGYGLNSVAIDELIGRGARVILAVDCGISGASEVAYAREQGVDTIIVDHHQVPPVLPRAVAVINPHQPGCPYPFKGLCGVGLAYQVARALLDRAGRGAEAADRWLDLVAVGTVADVVPLLGENRVLVARGLPFLNPAARPGLRALIARSGLKKPVNASTIAYALAPRLNAAGRLDSAQVSLDLLATRSEAEAHSLAERLDLANRERQNLTETALIEARTLVEQRGELPKILVLASDRFTAGIVGLVAARLKEEFARPALVAAREPEVIRGSARSIDEYPIAAALARCSDLLLRHGGHDHAAGFSLAPENWAALCERLENDASERIPESALVPSLRIDAEVRLERLDYSLLDLIESLEPFGCGNERPRFITRGLRVVERRCVGASGAHLKLKLHDGRQAWDAIGFGLADRPVADRLDLAYEIERNDWNGRTAPQLRLLDLQSTSITPRH